MARQLTPARMLLSVAAVAACAAMAAPPPAPPPPSLAGQPDFDESARAATEPEHIDVHAIPVLDLAHRLAALTPAEPSAYFLLGEEVAAEASLSADARMLAQQLFVLAYELDRASRRDTGGATADPALGRSVCLALAALTTDDGERRWLIALARSLDTSRTDPQFDAPGPGPGRREASLDLATALGFIRSGEGRRAEQLLLRPDVAALLQQYEGLLSPFGGAGASTTLRRQMGQWPSCPECRNRRIVTRPGEGGGSTQLCPTCRGNPGPTLSDAEVLFQLRLESALLSGIHRSWAAQYSADSGAPLRDLDPAELAATYDVDPAHPYWQGDRWGQEPARPPSPPESPADAADPGQRR